MKLLYHRRRTQILSFNHLHINDSTPKASKLSRKEMLSRIIPGRALIDVAIDQEGYLETSYPNIHDVIIKIKEGIIHYAVTNMSGVEFSNT